MNIEYVKTVFATRQKLLKEEEDKCSELTAQIEAAEAGVSEAEAVINELRAEKQAQRHICQFIENGQTHKHRRSQRA